MPIASNEKYNQLGKMAGTFLVHKAIRLLKSKINDLSELINFLEKNQRSEPVNGEERQFLGYRVVGDINFPKEIELDLKNKELIFLPAYPLSLLSLLPAFILSSLP